MKWNFNQKNPNNFRFTLTKYPEIHWSFSFNFVHVDSLKQIGPASRVSAQRWGFNTPNFSIPGGSNVENHRGIFVRTRSREFLIPADPPGGNNENDLWRKNMYPVSFLCSAGSFEWMIFVENRWDWKIAYIIAVWFLDPFCSWFFAWNETVWHDIETESQIFLGIIRLSFLFFDAMVFRKSQIDRLMFSIPF